MKEQNQSKACYYRETRIEETLHFDLAKGK